LLVNCMAIGEMVIWIFFGLLVAVGSSRVHKGDSTAWRPVRTKPVNILLILADDLGFGDTSVYPFVGSEIRTPHLEKMAEQGAILTNYHTAAATCTPSRASLLTGMNPLRLGIKAVFEYGEKGKSNRDDWLVQVPTAPMIFAEHQYATFHSGKWHLGGMRNDDLDMRLLSSESTHNNATSTTARVGHKRCHHPGPNQQGFQNYVSVLDGPGAPRQNELQIENRLYSHGCQHLLENDQLLPPSKYNVSGWLSYCEARHAMRGMSEAVAQSLPFYMHLWFHAPHGPWQHVPGYDDLYPDSKRPKSPSEGVPCNGNVKNKKHCVLHNKQIAMHGDERFLFYRTMVSDMDKQVGMVLNHIAELGIAEDTLVVFTSDNGPEDGAGTAGVLRGNKRHLYEGGIRVPAIVQWKNTIPARSLVSSLVTSTDLFATFLDAAEIVTPAHVHIDGLSMLQELVTAAPAPVWSSKMNNNEKALTLRAATHDASRKKGGAIYHRRKQQLQERLYLWMNDFEGPRRTAAIVFDYKILLNEHDIPWEMFDLKYDPNEKNNLLERFQSPEHWKPFVAQFEAFKTSLPPSPFVGSSTSMSLSRQQLLKQRQNSTVHLAVVERVFHSMYMYARRGDEGHRTYLGLNPGLKYDPSPLSDQRPMRTNMFNKGMTMTKAQELRKTLLSKGSCGTTPCSCDIPTVSQVNTLPFPGLDTTMTSSSAVDNKNGMWWNPITPQSFFNATRILQLVVR
jgi:arylsulfatase A